MPTVSTETLASRNRWCRRRTALKQVRPRVWGRAAGKSGKLLIASTRPGRFRLTGHRWRAAAAPPRHKDGKTDGRRPTNAMLGLRLGAGRGIGRGLRRCRRRLPRPRLSKCSPPVRPPCGNPARWSRAGCPPTFCRWDFAPVGRRLKLLLGRAGSLLGEPVDSAALDAGSAAPAEERADTPAGPRRVAPRACSWRCRIHRPAGPPAAPGRRRRRGWRAGRWRSKGWSDCRRFLRRSSRPR